MKSMRRHGLLTAGWCVMVRECRRCRMARAAVAKRRLRAMIEVERIALADELRAESGREWRA